ncbi:hypothetical protein [Symbiopectobacterium purcellii]|uniref:Uncharacterized protein n=1 Tax=Symbiopectobacterium purcellii TaxID=2871826 RepID=A0ABX9APP8_9ENTR|nr:hypothetical protein [Symbiopectobacterium purcellii]QZN94970.1 hypothetical protein K6K13_17280 [Symbiopectobacterium purcellii]
MYLVAVYVHREPRLMAFHTGTVASQNASRRQKRPRQEVTTSWKDTFLKGLKKTSEKRRDDKSINKQHVTENTLVIRHNKTGKKQDKAFHFLRIKA